MLSDATGWSCVLCNGLVREGRGLFQCTVPYFHLSPTFLYFRQKSRVGRWQWTEPNPLRTLLRTARAESTDCSQSTPYTSGRMTYILWRLYTTLPLSMPTVGGWNTAQILSREVTNSWYSVWGGSSERRFRCAYSVSGGGVCLDWFG
jgi:hypothetical protein